MLNTILTDSTVKRSFKKELSKEAQEQYGSRKSYASMEESGERYVLTAPEVSFLASRDSFYRATAGENAWPWVQL